MWPELEGQSPNQYHRTQDERLVSYEAGLVAGQYRPFVYPWDSLPAVYLILALLLLPRLPRGYVKVLRWPTLVVILGHCIYVIRTCRTVGFTGGYGIGLSATWGCIMTFALLFFNDVKTDFERLETGVGAEPQHGEDNVNGSALSSSVARDRVALNPRKASNAVRSDSALAKNMSSSYQLAWQAYPQSLSHCLDWTLDLVTSFRGVNWNFRDPTLSNIETSGDENNQDSGPRTEAHSSPSIKSVRTQALIAFFRLYLTFDLMRAIQTKDPYFYGGLPIDAGSPSVLYTEAPFLLKFSRLTITSLSVYSILNLIFQLCPIFFSSIPILIPYPSTLAITRTPLLSATMYEVYWGPLLPSVASKGLAGFWGRFWHQMFRFGISQPSAYIIKRYNLDSRSNTARTIQVLTAFCLSGAIHACASYTSSPPIDGTTHPITGPWAFFMLQGIGILLQSYVTRAIGSRSFPVWLRQSGNVLVVLAWAWFTGPLLADDFARCGVWLFEPFPVSVMQGLSGNGWWRWGGRWAGWWSDPGGRWWKSGIAMY